MEEYAPEIIHIKGIHNKVADAISRLEYDPAKLGSHGRKDITEVMAISNRNGKGDHSNLVRGIGCLDTCKYPDG